MTNNHQSETGEVIAAIMTKVEDVAHCAGGRGYVVGGVVRDILSRGDSSALFQDVDIVIEGDAREIGRIVAPQIGGRLELFDRFLTAKIIRPHFPFEIDLVSARSERYERSGDLPTVTRGSLSDDLRRRDFTINAMALPLSVIVEYLRGEIFHDDMVGEVLDPLGGRADLREGIVRILHPESFFDDPTRLFRAIRYGARCNAVFCPDTELAFHTSIQQLDREIVSANRVLQEIRKIVTENNPIPAINWALESGILDLFLGIDTSRGKQISGAIQRLLPVRERVTATEWWHIIQWLLFWAGMIRSSRIESALQRRRRDIETMYQEVDLLAGCGDSAALGARGKIAWSGLIGGNIEKEVAIGPKRGITGIKDSEC